MVKIRDNADSGDLEIDFMDCGEDDVIRMDSDEHKRKMGQMHRVDCVALPPLDPCLLIEFKDPSYPDAPVDRQVTFITKIRRDEFTMGSLVPKCMDSLRYMLGIRPERTRYHFYVIIGIEKLTPLGFNPQIIVAISDKLRSRLTEESGVVPDASAMMAIEDWNKRVPQYPVRRISATTGVAS